MSIRVYLFTYLKKRNSMKKILGLDLGTTSIGWGLINETHEDGEQSNIVASGVRIVSLLNKP